MKKIYIILLFTFTFYLLPQLCNSQCGPYLDFDSLSKGMNIKGSYVLALAMKDSVTENLYAGGYFKIAGRKPARNVALWKDTIFTYPPTKGEWIALGTGTDSDVCALAMFHNKLYAGGKFDTAGGVACSHIARWDTLNKTWDSLLGKLNGNVYALCVYHNQLYAGGDFTIADGDTVNRIAVWKDSVWAAVSKGFDTGAVYALAVSNDTLYAGGSFLKSNGLVVNHIAKLSGSNWDSLGGGTNNTVYALTDFNYFGQGLVVGGAFTKSGNVSTNYLSVFYYYNQSWAALGGGTNDTVRALDYGEACEPEAPANKGHHLLSFGNTLLVGGNFDSAFGMPNHFIAAYQSSDSSVSLNGPVYAIVTPNVYMGGDNFTGGRFSYSKNPPGFTPDSVFNVAYMLVCTPCGAIETIIDNSSVNVFPNPSNGKFTLEVKNEELRMKNIEVYNILGEKVYSSNYPLTTNLYSLDLSSQPNGIYLYRVVSQSGELIGEGKLIIQK